MINFFQLINMLVAQPETLRTCDYIWRRVWIHQSLRERDQALQAQDWTGKQRKERTIVQSARPGAYQRRRVQKAWIGTHQSRIQLEALDGGAQVHGSREKAQIANRTTRLSDIASDFAVSHGRSLSSKTHAARQSVECGISADLTSSLDRLIIERRGIQAANDSWVLAIKSQSFLWRSPGKN